MKKMLVSFSAGETSGYMAWWLKNNLSHEYEMVFVFANTGQENEETLEFAHRCDQAFGLNLVWIEAVIHHGVRKGPTHKIVDFHTASREGEPFEEAIKKYMIPNPGNAVCTRDLKERPIMSYARSIGWKKGDYVTAIGIRTDEIDRVSPTAKQNHLVYPLVSTRPMTKPKVNFWWSQQPFRLELKGYQGNCKTCWKKSRRKLLTINEDNPEAFDFFRRMEDLYGDFISPTKAHNPKIKPPIRFFREKMSVDELLSLDPSEWKRADDDSIVYDESLDLTEGCVEGCEIDFNTPYDEEPN